MADLQSESLAGREQELKAKIDEWERTKEHRENLANEVKDLSKKLQVINKDIESRTKELQALEKKPPASGNNDEVAAKQAKQLEYYESEVRRLEARLTEQKVAYDKQLKVHQDRLKELETAKEEEDIEESAQAAATELFNNTMSKLKEEHEALKKQKSLVDAELDKQKETIEKQATQINDLASDKTAANTIADLQKEN